VPIANFCVSLYKRLAAHRSPIPEIRFGSLILEVMPDPRSARELMVNSQLRARGIYDERVLDAMLRVPREQFVPLEYRDHAYEDHPLPIGDGQTISQPYVVALMLEALELTGNDKVLEIGTGSGYVTALLAELAAQVFSIERHPTLASGAREVLTHLGYSNVQVFTGDGTRGLAEFSPFDAILVSAAAPQLPAALISQLGENGRMIIPVGDAESQHLELIRMVNGDPQIGFRGSVRFVPLVAD
jgi:protein-L-isoaspartate(D-aspartate) O-methyltransferase